MPDDLGPLWDDLAAQDVWSADLAAWRLAGEGPRAVTLLRQRLRPPMVLTPQRVQRLILDLDSDEFDTRQRASAELADASESIPALRRAIAANPPLETRRRIEDVLTHLDRKPSPEERRRCCEVRPGGRGQPGSPRPVAQPVPGRPAFDPDAGSDRRSRSTGAA